MPNFRELHQPGNPFVLANAWDAGSARLMDALGAKAIATTSAGHAFTLGRPDMGNVSREEAISHARDLVAATPLPVSGDLENGYGDTSDAVAETISIAGQSGLAGACIEDTALPQVTPYDFDEAVTRIEAASQAAKNLKHDFVLAARADGWMNRQYDFAEAMRRAKAFEAAGADVIYIPLLKDIDMVREVCRNIKVPVNVLCTGSLLQHDMNEFASAGVARISLGSMAARLVQKTMLDLSRQIFSKGEFSLLSDAAPAAEINELLSKGSR